MRDFNHSVGVLVKAYFDGTLEHWNCKACAVGNLVAAAKGYAYHRCQEYGELKWAEKSFAAWPRVLSRFGSVELSNMSGEAKDEIESTGYTPAELSRIEVAFESYDEDNFTALMAVVDVLADIHGINLEATAEAKKLFTRDSSVRELQQKELSVN